MSTKRAQYEIEAKKLEVKKKMQEMRAGLPHLYERPWYAWAWAFFESRNKMQLLCAANQISKSSTMIRKAIEWAGNPKLWPELWPHHNPRIFWYFYPDQATINNEVQEKWEPEFLPRGEYKNHPTYGWSFIKDSRDYTGVRFNSGIVIQFKSHTQKISNLQSGTIAAIMADEELPVHFYPELNARLIASQGYFLSVFTATLNQDLWKRAIEGKGDSEMFPTAFKLQVSMYDCLTYKDGKPSTWTEERIQGVLDSCSTTAEKERRVFGKFVAAQGLKYGNFDSARHYVKPFEIPSNWHRYCGIDHGSGGENHKPAISFIAVRPDFRYGVVYKHWRGDDGSTYTAGDTLNKFLEMKVGSTFTSQRVDPRATDLLTLAARTGEPFVGADSSHSLGEDVLNTLFKNDMLLLFDEKDEMPKLGGELSALMKDTPKQRAKDDSADSLRYGVVTIPWDWTYLKGELSESERKKNAKEKSGKKPLKNSKSKSGAAIREKKILKDGTSSRQSLKSGTTSASDFASRLEEILSLCVKHGISEMSLSDGTHFSFFHPNAGKIPNVPLQSRSQEESTGANLESTGANLESTDVRLVSNAQVWRTVKDGKVVDAAPLEISPEEAEEIILNDMMVNDPAGYEQAMIDKLKNA